MDYVGGMKPTLCSAVGLALGIALVLAPQSLRAQSLEAKKPKAELTSYLRYQEDRNQNARLQVAIVTLQRPADGVKVDLVGAVHIGDRAYYQDLNKLFRGYDAVLYELIADAPPAKGQKGRHPVNFIQRWMQTALKLSFQLDEINYQQRNFIHADMDPKMFAARQKARGESMLTLIWSSMRQEMARKQKGAKVEDISLTDLLRIILSPDSSHEMKLLLAKQFQQSDGLLAAMGKDSVILVERNNFALKVLDKTVAASEKKNFAIFYGAAHLAGMEKTLTTKKGFKRTKLRWLTAWDIPAK